VLEQLSCNDEAVFRQNAVKARIQDAVDFSPGAGKNRAGAIFGSKWKLALC